MILTEEETKATVEALLYMHDGVEGQELFHHRNQEIALKLEAKMDMAKNRIVCSANYHPGYPVIMGARHWDQAMHRQYESLLRAIPDLPEGHHFAQGFIDKFGEWKTREEAWVIAEAAGQIVRRVGGDESNGGRLYSENLY